MKCIQTDGSGIDTLKTVDIAGPELSAGEVLVEVRAVSLNFRDLLVAKGLYGGDYSKPFIVCSDMAGVVLETSAGVTEFKQGDRVFNAPFRFWPAGEPRREWMRTLIGGAGVDGVLAERIAYPALSLVKIPEHMSFIEGSTLTIAALTAWAAVITHGKARPGEWVLLHGTGGVSIFAAQIARMAGARTILTTSSKEKAAFVRENFGVHETVDYRDKDWKDKVKEITGGSGVDVVVEVVGGANLAESMGACATGARISLIGVLGGLESKIRTMDLVIRRLKVTGILMESTEELRAMTRAFEAAEIRPHIDKVFPFENTIEAFKYMESQKHIGKVAIEVNP
jgi:NADPH:quinone reductase-like Zn-dependent oxidoreductase